MLPIIPMDADKFGRCSHRLARRVKRGVGTRLLYIMCGANPHRIKWSGHSRISRRCSSPCWIIKMLVWLVLTQIRKELEQTTQETVQRIVVWGKNKQSVEHCLVGGFKSFLSDYRRLIMDYFSMYRDIWTFHKKYIDKIKFADDKMWAEIVTESSELGKKYDNCSFILSLTMNEVNEFEKISKSVHSIQN